MWRLNARLATVLSMSALASACTGQLGLANAPRLGRTRAADSWARDALIANRVGSCGALTDPRAPGSKATLCLSSGRTRVPAARPAPSKDSDPIVMQWVEHFYSHWPCESLRHSPPRETPVARSSASQCGVYEGLSP